MYMSNCPRRKGPTPLHSVPRPHRPADRLTGVYKNTARGILALVFRCHPEGGRERLSDESTAVTWLTPAEVIDRMAEVFAVRVTDALLDGAPRVRAHDGRRLAGGA